MALIAASHRSCVLSLQLPSVGDFVAGVDRDVHELDQRARELISGLPLAARLQLEDEPGECVQVQVELRPGGSEPLPEFRAHSGAPGRA